MGEPVDVWDLNADLAKLEAWQAGWKAQVKQLSWAADTITSTANRVLGGEEWTGKAADRYDRHRRKLIPDLDDCADLAGKVAQALGECVQTLEFNQNSMIIARSPLQAKMRWHAQSDGRHTFYPEDDEQTKMANELVKTYNDIRGRVDQKLNAQLAVLNSAVDRLRGWERTWAAKSLRMLNYNIQQGGGGNKPWPWDHQGTEEGDLGQLAQRIIDGKVDVATLQEIFKDSAGKLQDELNKRAAPGENWEVHFGKGSSKWHWDEFGKNDFGNAVVVRTGNGVTTGGSTVTDLGPGDEGRSTTKVRINVE
ncbi:hypothetical protein [Nocardia brasiliensis]|uniref:hypothetical protein n=1 Tax=Nocardia brasiliensis TaxID=37326 RepID=UPI00366D0F14